MYKQQGNSLLKAYQLEAAQKRAILSFFTECQRKTTDCQAKPDLSVLSGPFWKLCSYKVSGLQWCLALHSFSVSQRSGEARQGALESTMREVSRWLVEAKRRLRHFDQSLACMLDGDFLCKAVEFFGKGWREELNSAQQCKSMECQLMVQNNRLVLEYYNHRQEVNVREIGFHVQDLKRPLLSHRIPHYLLAMNNIF